jgi:hypothetical protein
MSDLAAARDRAWMVVRDTLEARHGLYEGEMAEQVVAALLNHPEVLRALAGALAADVAAVVPPPAMTDALIDAQRELRVLRAERDAAVGLASLPRRVVIAIASVMDGGAAAVPEGVDAADEQDANRCTGCGKQLRSCCYMCPAGPHEDMCDGLQDEPDGMDLEAQGEMADELTAAQAAIQRVRNLAALSDRSGLLGSASLVRRALAGDTTEEPEEGTR